MWLPQEVIRRKRDGHTLDAMDIQRFVTGIADGSLSDGQVAAFAMAVFIKGMDVTERIALTEAMRSLTSMPLMNTAMANAATCPSLRLPSAMPATNR